MSAIRICEWALKENVPASDEALEKAQQLIDDMKVSLVGTIVCEAMEEPDDESDRLLALYRNGDANERAIIDAVLVNLCGWTMKNVIRLMNDEKPVV